VQRYKFWPGAASDLKNVCPILHTGGSGVPTVNGRVAVALEKSIFLACDRISTIVWLFAAPPMRKASARIAAKVEDLVVVFIHPPDLDQRRPSLAV
jgi:hypothetical protein